MGERRLVMVDMILTEMTVGGRSYDILGILVGAEKSVVGHAMVGRAKEMNAHNGKEEQEHILKYQDEIPHDLRDRITFVFTDHVNSDHPGCIHYVCWHGDRWVEYFDWDWVDDPWDDSYKVLRRK